MGVTKLIDIALIRKTFNLITKQISVFDEYDSQEYDTKSLVRSPIVPYVTIKFKEVKKDE